MNEKSIRFKQRLQNLNKAHKMLEKGVQIPFPTEIERQGIIQSFEFTFELSWKTLKDFLESQEVLGCVLSKRCHQTRLSLRNFRGWGALDEYA
jgi:hypothetical protein